MNSRPSRSLLAQLWCRPHNQQHRDKKIKHFTGKKTKGDQLVEDFVEELKTTFEARQITSEEKVDFIMSHLEGPAKEEVRMYSEKERSNPDFLLEVITQAFGKKQSSSQLTSGSGRRMKHFEGTRTH